MPSDPGFVEHVLDLVGFVGPVSARSMFGGHGVYSAGVMFGLLDDGELFLKTDEKTRATFVDAGCRQWVYVNKKVRMENTGYFRPPEDAHEDAEAMLPWARLAVDAALRARAAKVAREARKGGRKAGIRKTGNKAASPAREPAPKRSAAKRAASKPARKAKPAATRAARRPTR